MFPVPVLLALTLLMVLPNLAEADSFRAPRLKQGTSATIQSYGRQNPLCGEWTDGCAVCVATNGHAQCSTPGIACTPAGLTCKRPARP